MVVASRTAPLIALDAIVIDTETTGLDPAKARIVEIGLVRLSRGRIDEKEARRFLVRPDEPIPAAITAIHGIDDAAVAGAPDFASVWPQVAGAVGDAVVIGHSVGFDLAVIKRECERAGLAFRAPRALDTRLLAEAAQPTLAGYSLESLSNWLGVDMSERHSAVGDALTAARIFRALVPKLRDRGIRTLAEAMRACRGLTGALDAQHRAGWLESEDSLEEGEQVLRRIDTYPYRHRIREVMTAPPKFADPAETLGAAAARMIAERISALYVRLADQSEAPLAKHCGIITERDVMRTIARHGADALAMRVEQVMSTPLAAVPAEAFVYLALGRMSRMKIRHLGVVDEIGRVVGALSARDLLRLRASEAISLGDEIDQADDIHDLGQAWHRLPLVAASLLSEGVSARDIAAVVSRRLGALTRQVAILSEQRLREEGHGEPPCAYSLMVLGSAGRGESLLAMDQDNAIVFAEGKPGGDADQWFARLGEYVADLLHEAGVPYCTGGVMAKNPQWRGSLATWKERIADWIGRSNPEDLLAVDIFFDLRSVYGDGALANEIRQTAFDAARGQTGFAKLLAEAAGETDSGLGFFGGIKTVQGRIDLKKTGLFGVVTAARVLAVAHHVLAHSTPARIAGLIAKGVGGQEDLQALADAQAVFVDLILAQQVADIEAGHAPTNAVAVANLSARDRARLREALKAVPYLEELTRDLLFRE